MTTSSTTSAFDEFERVVASKDIMYTKTHGHQLLVNNLYACRREDSNPREFFLAEFKIFVQRHFTTYYQKEIISLEKFRGYQLFHENRKTFPPRTISNIRYLTGFSPEWEIRGLKLSPHFTSKHFKHIFQLHQRRCSSTTV